LNKINRASCSCLSIYLLKTEKKKRRLVSKGKKKGKKKKENPNVSITTVVLQTPQSCWHELQSSTFIWQIESPHFPFDDWI